MGDCCVPAPYEICKKFRTAQEVTQRPCTGGEVGGDSNKGDEGLQMRLSRWAGGGEGGGCVKIPE